MKLCNKFAAEFFGTAVLVLGGCGTALFGHVGFLGVALAFGLTIVAAAYGIGHISGAHLNPAVSLGVFVNGRMSAKEMFCYWCAQILGAIAAAAILFGIAKSAGMEIGTFAANGYGDFFSAADVEAGYLQTNVWGAFVTFVFLIVILGVTDSKHANGAFGGLAIGLTLTLIHLISIPLTNTSVNPARSISQALFSENALALPQLWLFIVAPLVGAALAGLCYKCITCEGNCKK